MRGAVADAAEQERLRRLRASEDERRVEVVERRAFLAVVGAAPAAAAAMAAEVGLATRTSIGVMEFCQ
jgi:hypothetical protein